MADEQDDQAWVLPIPDARLLGPATVESFLHVTDLEHDRRRAQVMEIADALLSRIAEHAEDGDAEMLSDLTDSFWNLAQGAQALLEIDQGD